MGLYSSFYSSLSGLSTNASNLSVIGNNLANLNTIGYKGSVGTFQDLYSASLGTGGNGNPIQVGLGTRLGAVSQNFGQGSYQSSSNVTDMAISGQGFFALQTQAGARAYSRAGNFTVDNAGGLVDPNGNHVLGWNRTGGTVSITGTPVPIQLDMGITAAASVTTTMGGTTNLDANALSGANAVFHALVPGVPAVLDPVTHLVITPDVPAIPAYVTPYAPGASYTTTMQVYDSLGASHNLIFKYTKSLPNAITALNPVTGAITAQATDPALTTNAWDLSVTTDDTGIPPTSVSGFPARITFNSSGSQIGLAANPTLAVTPWSNGAAAGNIAWDILTGAVSSLTGYASDSTTSNAVQNGYGAGTILNMTVNQDGTINGTFSNGQIVPLAQVALAVFSNQNGLAKQGDNTWTETLASGAGNIGAATQGGRGAVLGSNLELSNVDVAEEFTKLIIAQRGYQANSKIVTTADSLIQDVLNMIR